MLKNGKTKKVVVTGGAGFIGSHLVDALVGEGYLVVVIDNLSTGKRSQVNKAVRFVKADIRDLKKIKPYFKGAELVFHTAAQARMQPSIKDPTATLENNVSGTLNILLAARDAGVKRVIYSASSSFYGDQKTVPYHEEMTSNFKNPYALFKYVGEQLCKLFSDLYGLETVSLRFFHVYGPRQLSASTASAYATVIGIFLKQAKQGKPLTIVGDGNMCHDFTHVYDIVRANMLAAQSKKVGKGEVINIGTGKNYSINEVAAMILAPNTRQLLGSMQAKTVAFESAQPEVILAAAIKDNRAKYIPFRINESQRSLANNSKARDLLGWKPTISFEEGLAMLKSS
ncbi:MAG: NAD-dependent epimerase/dehydratase family protein [Candidatus Yanofskybacteria bacterium]|nr:NAD-dependent epimerase/dehydratase family protein [Candidatus Yanofskybacteria bacterium]